MGDSYLLIYMGKVLIMIIMIDKKFTKQNLADKIESFEDWKIFTLTTRRGYVVTVAPSLAKAPNKKTC